MSYIARAKKQWKYMVYAILAYTIVFALRYGVGADYLNYLNNYKAYSTSTGHWGVSQSFEIGFTLLTQLMANLHLHPTMYFGAIAFIQLYFTVLPFKKTDADLYPYIVLAFMLCGTWLSFSNVLRQAIAFSLWAYALRFIAEKKPWQYYTTILIAVSMHFSAIILLVFYPIFNYRKEWFRNTYIQLLGLGIALVIMNINIIQSLIMQFETLIVFAGYEDYLNKDQMQVMITNVSVKLGFLLTLIFNILLIIYSKKIKDYFKSNYLTISYNLFYIGVLLWYILISSIGFRRLNFFFINLNIIIAAYALLYARRNNRTLFIVLIILMALTFIALMSKAYENDTLYLFYWQSNLYYLK